MISLRSRITQVLLEYFILHEGTEMYVNDIARRFNLESGNLTRKLRELEKDGILKSRWQGAQRYYSLNTFFPLLKEYKKIITRTIGLEHKLRSALRDLSGIKEAFIFGSYAGDRMDPLSDIDVMVIGDHDTIELNKRIAGLQRSIDRPVNVISLTVEEYRKKKGKDLFFKSVQKKEKIVLL